MRKITVMITGIGGGGHGEQILKALRIAKTPYEIIGCDMFKFSKGLKNVDYQYILPPATDPNYIKLVLDICKKHNVKALFHGSEPELLIMDKNREIFSKEDIFLPINPHVVIETCMNKLKTIQFLKDHGFPYPMTRVIKKLSDTKNWSYFPAIIKPSIGGGGSANTFIVQDKHELEIITDYILNLHVCREVIIQEYKGTDDTEYTVGVLFDMNGNFLNSIAVKRNLKSSLSCKVRIPNRYNKKEYGPFLSISTGISQGKVGSFTEITNICEKVAKEIGAQGSINIQCRLHSNEVYIFEINPRFSGTTSIRALVGYNEPDILIRRHIFGEDIKPRFTYRSGIVVRGLEEVFFDKDCVKFDIIDES